MFIRAKSLCLNNCTINIIIDPLNDCDFSTCNGNSSCDFRYSNFANALMDLDMLCTKNSSVKIFLMDGEYFIGQYGIKISRNITIHGQNNTVINCGDITGDQSSTSLLHFYDSTIVKLNSLQFNSCQRPLRFDNISKLIISQCVFRYEILCTKVDSNINFCDQKVLRVLCIICFFSIADIFQMVLWMS